MSRRRRKKWPFLLVLLAACGGGGWWWWTHRELKATGPEFETTTVTRGNLEKTVQATGDLNPLVQVEIGSQISGTIAKLNVDFNSKVKAGDLLCQLDPATYEAAYSQALADEASARAALELQQRTLERKTLLLKQEFFAQADYDKAKADLSQAEAAVQVAEARVKRAKVDLDRCTIYAPIDGVVVDRTAEIGQTIAASFNAPKLFILANDLTQMQINAKISEADIGQLSVGQPVRFNVDAYTEDFKGEVVQVRNSPIKEENVVNYDAIIAVENPDLKLKPGMNAVVYITTGERTDVLRVPNAALRFQPPRPGGEAEAEGSRRGPGAGSPGGGGGGGRRGEGGPPSGPRKGPAAPSDEKTVYFLPKVPTDPLVPVKVRVGLNDGVQSEVLEGLKEGDVLVTLVKPQAGGAQTIMNNPFGGPMGGGRRGR
jgi:HlyD family secretion protein